MKQILMCASIFMFFRIPVEGVIFVSSISPKYYWQRSGYEFNTGNQIIVTRCENKTIPRECIYHDEFPMDEDDLPRNVVTSVSLENHNLSVLPILMHNHLRCLNLARNNIPLEDLLSFGEMNHLRKLLLDHQKALPNDGQSFPQTQVSYPNLQILDLSGNHIKHLSEDFEYVFPSLHFLNLSENQILAESLLYLPNSLYWLYLKNTGLRLIDIQSKKLLKNLILDNNFYERLDVINPQRSSLTMKGIRSLKFLSLVNCSIKFISDDYFKEALQLHILDLSFNKLEELSTSAIEIPSLSVLLLNHNRLTRFPYTKNLKQLINLSLNYNQFEIISLSFRTLVSLKVLSLRGNRLHTIVNYSFNNLGFLHRLDLAENQLNRMPNNWTSALSNLIDLNLNYNKFTIFSDIHIGNLPSLKRLHLINNSLVGYFEGVNDVLPNTTRVYRN